MLSEVARALSEVVGSMPSLEHVQRLLLDSVSALDEAAAEAGDSGSKQQSVGTSIVTWLLIGLSACCCWGITNCALHIVIMRRPMHDFGGRIKRVHTVDEFREALATADANGQLLVVLACAGWHHGCRVAARALTQMSLESSPESCVFVMCDLATATSVAQVRCSSSPLHSPPPAHPSPCAPPRGRSCSRLW